MTSIGARLALAPFCALILILGLAATELRAQSPSPEEERLKILTDPEEVKKKVGKEKSLPPLELFRSQVAPFDILPYVKANHWSTLSLDLRSNYEDYAGTLQTSPVPLLGLPQEIVYLRDARLLKTQRSRLGLQILLPRIPKDVVLELGRPDAIRADELWQANMRPLEPHQMLILFLTKEPSDSFALWNRYQALYPRNADRGDLQALERLRYYRLVLPMEPDRPPVSPHPLTWSTTSHVIWDGMPADNLNPAQQQAMIDWLHWGGQLILNGGAGAPFNVLKDSFIGAYLPADASGENALLTESDLLPLSQAYRPLVPPRGTNLDDENLIDVPEPIQRLTDGYAAAVPIRPAATRPVFLNGLSPHEGAVPIPLGESGERQVGVEWRVGRGRVLMLAIDLNDPAIASWPGIDTFVRRVVLRRPEDSRLSAPPFNRGFPSSTRGALPGPDLTWFRILSRDLHVPEIGRTQSQVQLKEDQAVYRRRALPPDLVNDLDVQSPQTAVAEWFDDASLPRFCVRRLEEASGIKIPSSAFVLKVILAYVLLLVPLNWLICRYVLGRREFAWLVVPLLSLGFAVGVERAAAYDMGYDSAVDEIDVVEIHGGYPRAHVSRFLSLYSTGRTRFQLSYPNEPTALALPLDNGRSLRGEDVSRTVWRSYPVPTLEDYLVQPRSLAFVRAEHLSTIDGAIRLESEEGSRRVVNASNLELRDAVLIDHGAGGPRHAIRLGTIPRGGTVSLDEPPDPGTPPADLSPDFDPEALLSILRNYHEDRPENSGEIRLVAWAPGNVEGQLIEPPVDRRRGFMAIVVHLKTGDPPSPLGPVYDSLVRAPERPASEFGVPDSPDREDPRESPRMPGIGPPSNDPDPIRRAIRNAQITPPRRAPAATAPPLKADPRENPPR
ncbi:MAG: hypothetical protein AB7I30_15415 [Isosphaeraceae bacterium]